MLGGTNRVNYRLADKLMYTLELSLKDGGIHVVDRVADKKSQTMTWDIETDETVTFPGPQLVLGRNTHTLADRRHSAYGMTNHSMFNSLYRTLFGEEPKQITIVIQNRNEDDQGGHVATLSFNVDDLQTELAAIQTLSRLYREIQEYWETMPEDVRTSFRRFKPGFKPAPFVVFDAVTDKVYARDDDGNAIQLKNPVVLSPDFDGTSHSGISVAKRSGGAAGRTTAASWTCIALGVAVTLGAALLH